jgi:hypothetical protein
LEIRSGDNAEPAGLVELLEVALSGLETGGDRAASRARVGPARKRHGVALRLASAVRYNNIGTFEFLADTARGDLAFTEANPRLQVEHTRPRPPCADLADQNPGMRLNAARRAIHADKAGGPLPGGRFVRDHR